MKRFLRIGRLFAVGLPILLIGTYLVEHYRGEYMWQRFRAEWEAKGEIFEVEPLLPKPVASKDNFAASPLFDEFFKIRAAHPAWFTGNANPPTWDAMGRLYLLKDEIGRGSFEPQKQTRWNNRDLPWDWRGARVAPMVVLRDPGNYDLSRKLVQSLSREEAATRLLTFIDNQWAGEWASLHEHCHRTSFVSPESWMDRSIPFRFEWVYYLYTIGEHSLRRCAAYLVNDDHEAAFREWHMAWRFAEYAQQGPLWGQTIARLLATKSLQPLWEGASRHQWDDAQLREAQVTLKRWSDELPEHLLRSIRMERNLFLDATLYPEKRQIQTELEGIDAKIFPIVPEGWIFQNALSLCRPLQDYALTSPSGNVVHSVLHTDRLEKWQWHGDRIDQSHMYYHIAPVDRPPYRWHPFRWLAFYGGGVHPMAFKTAHEDMQVIDVVITGLGCERYYLAHGNYPSSLNELVPDFLDAIPDDRRTEKPLLYTRRRDGTPVVWAVGMNEVDDGGSPDRDPEYGDIVWQYQLSDYLLEMEEKLKSIHRFR